VKSSSAKGTALNRKSNRRNFLSGTAKAGVGLLILNNSRLAFSISGCSQHWADRAQD
jgi:hypothetical protein